MADRDGYADGDVHEAVERAARLTRFGWAAIVGAVGLLGCAALALAAVCVVTVVACLYVVVARG
ncbi:hypothetical protein [Streptomyces sp. NPDC093591]|uniref:hypothetical protein n=1 Tax=Streptomyces sp. NPDC093591 TaxID=3366044 RepID=UPI0038120C1A